VKHSEWKAGIARTCRALRGCALSKLGTVHEGRGWPDLFLAHAEGPAGGFWLELKVGRDRPSQEQRDRAEQLVRAGARCYFLWTDGARQVLLDWAGEELAELRAPAETGPGFLLVVRLIRALA